MSEYTAEDFKNARFAEHENGRAAMRPQPGRLWHLGSVHMGDYDMAADGWVPVVEARITLDALEAAWEAAERADECRKGDVLIRQAAYGGYGIYPAASDGPLITARILSRAPKREPWADLADVLRNEIDLESDPGGIAHALHLKGWRKGGDDDE